MHLRDYLRKESLTKATFGRKLSPPVSAGKVGHWLEGRRRVSLREALQVHRLAGGQVTLEELAAMYREERGSIPQVSGAAAGKVYPNVDRNFV